MPVRWCGDRGCASGRSWQPIPKRPADDGGDRVLPHARGREEDHDRGDDVMVTLARFDTPLRQLIAHVLGIGLIGQVHPHVVQVIERLAK